jgi:hypothetical protein
MIDKKQIIAQAASDLGVLDAQWLYSLISFESGLDPLATNKNSGARGLIQIMPSTAQSMFGMSADDLINQYPDFESQVKNVVVPYLSRYKPFTSEQSLYMSVFYPAARSVPTDTSFSTLYKQNAGTNWETKYNTFVKQNPGILTVSDYINFVKRIKLKDFFFPIIIVSLLAAMYIFKK